MADPHDGQEGDPHHTVRGTGVQVLPPIETFPPHAEQPSPTGVAGPAPSTNPRPPPPREGEEDPR
eukprot:8920825-Pyramimonas_sp.AAC.1